ncbi:MAG: DNA polymerase III subunit gamma/tau [Gammaproteobacteria bacterium]|nr:MAG: DNA polymerase III subunit gamma/tau [Gammaproteobacteria bacterium]
MSYQVLARKWRPRSFEELVGQPHVQRALMNALEADRLHHAYLFTGTRGVGKTTIARILAKCLNCEQGVSAHPCGECESCRAIDEGRFVDLIEVDAASRTKVEDTRELLDNVQYAPTRGRYKVYLIDEVHMLSGHSFNALLKTLEEPPPHVKFLLATTDPQKLPVTVLSRCLQFNLKRMAPQQIVEHLHHVLEQEGIEHDMEALDLLARAADGSMRDALSLLDQAIAYAGNRVPADAVREMLGTVSRGHLHALLEHLADADAGALLAAVADLAEQAPDFAGVLAEIIGLLHRVAVMQQVPDALELTEEERVRLGRLAERLAPETVQLYYQIALQGRSDLAMAPDPRDAFEMTLLRMLAFRPLDEGDDSAQTPTGRTDAGNKGEGASPKHGQDGASRPRARMSVVPTAAASPVEQPPEPEPAGATAVADPRGDLSELEDWCALLPRLGLSAMTRELASHCHVIEHEAGRLVLGIDAELGDMVTDLSRQRLERSLRQYFADEALRLEIRAVEAEADTPARRRAEAERRRQQAARQAIIEDPVVQALQERLGAELIEETLQPLDEPDNTHTGEQTT